MFTFQRPSTETIKRFVETQATRGFSYDGVGATRGAAPRGYVVDHTRLMLGRGEDVFTDAKKALQSWRHFQLGWIEPCWPTTSIEEGSVVGILARSFGLWFLNACRIVYVVESPSSTTRYGYAYGTLPEHAESGEERFTVEWRAEDDSVWYEILAFSRPNKWYSKLGYPLARRLQRRFARESAAAMREVASVHSNLGV